MGCGRWALRAAGGALASLVSVPGARSRPGTQRFERRGPVVGRPGGKPSGGRRPGGEQGPESRPPDQAHIGPRSVRPSGLSSNHPEVRPSRAGARARRGPRMRAPEPAARPPSSFRVGARWVELEGARSCEARACGCDPPPERYRINGVEAAAEAAVCSCVRTRRSDAPALPPSPPRRRRARRRRPRLGAMLSPAGPGIASAHAPRIGGRQHGAGAVRNFSTSGRAVFSNGVPCSTPGSPLPPVPVSESAWLLGRAGVIRLGDMLPPRHPSFGNKFPCPSATLFEGQVYV
jgi:hypothetical protein